MSHAIGEVYLPEGTLIGAFEYDGTIDWACTAIVKHRDELEATWRSPANQRCCNCPVKGSVPVILWTDYGGGFYWDSTACLKCRAITGRREPFSFGEKEPCAIDGHPFPKTTV
jgi:hypothetical protein